MCDSKADRVVTVNVSLVQYKHNEEKCSTVYSWWVGGCVCKSVTVCTVISASQLSGT